MSTLIVIPARLGSTRLPDKPLRLLGARPLIQRVVERVLSFDLDASIVVATDDARVAAAAGEAGAAAVMTRADHPSGTDRVAEVLSLTAYARATLVVNVQGDEPFIARETVLAAIEPVASGQFAVGTAACVAPESILHEPSVVKVVRAADGSALYFSRAAIPHLRDTSDRALLDGTVLQHVGVYAYRPDALRAWVAQPPSALERIERLEQLRPLAHGIRIGVGITTAVAMPGIDTEEDLRRANAGWPEEPIRATPHAPAGAT